MLQGNSDDSEIISNTIAEISIILILIFFLLVGFTLVRGPVHNDRSTNRLLSEAFWQRAESRNCDFRVLPSGEGIELRDELLQRDDASKPLTVFTVGQAVPTAKGAQCLEDICRVLIRQVQGQDATQFRIHITGHTSSEWAEEKEETTPFQICHKDGTCENCRDPFFCNMQLSLRRALTVYDTCEALIVRGGIYDDLESRPTKSNRLLSVADYRKIFRATGASSSELRFLESTGEEDRGRSRRVEFNILQR